MTAIWPTLTSLPLRLIQLATGYAVLVAHRRLREAERAHDVGFRGVPHVQRRAVLHADPDYKRLRQDHLRVFLTTICVQLCIIGAVSLLW